MRMINAQSFRQKSPFDKDGPEVIVIAGQYTLNEFQDGEGYNMI